MKELIVSPPRGCFHNCPGCYLNQPEFKQYKYPHTLYEWRRLRKSFIDILDSNKFDRFHFFYMEEGSKEQDRNSVHWNQFSTNLALLALKAKKEVTYSQKDLGLARYETDILLSNITEDIEDAKIGVILSKYIHSLDELLMNEIPIIHFEPNVNIIINYTFSNDFMKQNVYQKVYNNITKTIEKYRKSLPEKDIEVKLTLEKPYLKEIDTSQGYQILFDIPNQYFNNPNVHFYLDSCFLKSIGNIHLLESYNLSETITANSDVWHHHSCPYLPNLGISDKICDICPLISQIASGFNENINKGALNGRRESISRQTGC